MCNKFNGKFAELVECIQEYNKSKHIAEIVPHPANREGHFDSDIFHKLVFGPNLPVLWRNVLLDYIYALPDKVNIDGCKEKLNITAKNNCTHTIEVNKLHNFVVKAVKCDPSDILCVDISKKLKKIPSLPSNLENYDIASTDKLKVAVKVSQPLTKLLQNIQKAELYKLNCDGKITIIDSYQCNPIPPYEVTELQALLSIMVTSQCYPLKWKEHFFWDAWLAVTIQLGLLKEVDDDNSDNEVFPCLWMKQVFYAENLVGSPENVHVLLMGQDPKRIMRDTSELRTATGVDINDN